MTTFLLKNDKRLHIYFGRRSSFFITNQLTISDLVIQFKFIHAPVA